MLKLWIIFMKWEWNLRECSRAQNNDVHNVVHGIKIFMFILNFMTKYLW
jgi:hypothetical protein